MKKRNDRFDAGRRALIGKGIQVAAMGSVAALGALAASPAGAQAKVSQATAMYQDKPNGTQRCDACMQFVPGKTPTSSGTCKLVEGVISPHGWCGLFVAKV